MHDDAALALSLWAAWRAPLVALAAGLLAALATRGLRLDWLGAAAAGIGAAAGFVALSGLVWPPAGSVSRLAPVAIATTIIALAAHARGSSADGAAGAGAGLLGGWFLAGAPLHLFPLLPWIEAAGTAAALAAGALVLGGLNASQVVLASASLACGLTAAHASHAWVLAALVPGAATIGGLPAKGRLLQPTALAVAAVASACVLAAGDLARFAFRPVEAAALAPVLALWLAARLAPRLHIVANGIGLAAATLLVWMIAGGR